MTQGLIQWLGDLLFRNWGIKLLALVLTAVLFVVTRNEVTRGFRVPLRVIEDPTRVLLSELPDTVGVEVRGPWARVNRLQDYDIPPVELDLREAQPGPLKLDPASVVMPPGVVMNKLVYDPVDLRFDPVIRRALPVEPVLAGEPAAHHRVARVQAHPARWEVRGGRSAVQGMRSLSTETIDVTGTTAGIVERQVSLLIAREHVELLGAKPGDPPTVRVEIVIEPVEGRRDVQAPITAGTDLEGVPERYRVEIRGPKSALQSLEEHGEPAVEGTAVETKHEGQPVLELRFDWASWVPASARSTLVVEPTVVRLPRA